MVKSASKINPILSIQINKLLSFCQGFFLVEIKLQKHIFADFLTTIKKVDVFLLYNTGHLINR